jgi:hypothetical protein
MQPDTYASGHINSVKYELMALYMGVVMAVKGRFMWNMYFDSVQICHIGIRHWLFFTVSLYLLRSQTTVDVSWMQASTIAHLSDHHLDQWALIETTRPRSRKCMIAVTFKEAHPRAETERTIMRPSSRWRAAVSLWRIRACRDGTRSEENHHARSRVRNDSRRGRGASGSSPQVRKRAKQNLGSGHSDLNSRCEAR